MTWQTNRIRFFFANLFCIDFSTWRDIGSMLASYVWLSSFHKFFSWRDCTFPVVCSRIIWQSSTDHEGMCLLLRTLPCTLSMFQLFLWYLDTLTTIAIEYILKSSNIMALTLFCPFKTSYVTQENSHISTQKSGSIFSIPVEDIIGNFVGNAF